MKLLKIDFKGQLVPFKLKIPCSSTMLIGCKNGDGDYVFKEGDTEIEKESVIDGFDCYRIIAPDDSAVKTYVYTDGVYKGKVIVNFNDISKSFVSDGGSGDTVTSVNEMTGDVVLKASDIKANNTQSIQANLERIDEEVEGCIDDIDDIQNQIGDVETILNSL